MKRWMLCLLCTITLGLGVVGTAGLASAEPASGAPTLKPADQQFLASLAQAGPEPATPGAPPSLWAAQGQQCPTTWCTAAAKEACQNTPLPNCDPWCSALGCDPKNCTEHCICLTRGCF